MQDPVKILEQGRRILGPILEAHGFRWVAGAAGNSSGGQFASGEYVRANRRLEIHFRHSLGRVTYHVGDRTVEHPAYMRALLGPGAGNQYPGFSAEPLDAFGHLAHVLKKFCRGFLSGSEAEFEEVANKVDADSEITGLKRLP